MKSPKVWKPTPSDSLEKIVANSQADRALDAYHTSQHAGPLLSKAVTEDIQRGQRLPRLQAFEQHIHDTLAAEAELPHNFAIGGRIVTDDHRGSCRSQSPGTQLDVAFETAAANSADGAAIRK